MIRQLLLGVALVALPALAHAQTASGGTVSDIVGFLVTNRSVQTNDFDRDQEAAAATRATLTQALLAAMTQLPVGSAASGFEYRFNPALGTVERASETFGPFYVERARTAGPGQVSVGFTLRYASFGSLDGYNLHDGALVTTANQLNGATAPFDQEQLTLGVKARTVTFFGNIGVTDRIDISAAVPLISLSVTGSRISIDNNTTRLQARAEASTRGIGDIAVRARMRLTEDGPAVAAAGAELRLPTGREEDLLGAGTPGIQFLGMGSAEAGPANVYGNVALGLGGVGNEVSYSGAIAVAATPNVTVVGELLARHLFGLDRIIPVTEPHPRIRNVTTTRLMPAGESQTTMYAVTGFKWDVASTWLLHGQVLFPLSDAGLTSKFTPTIALDYAFGR